MTAPKQIEPQSRALEDKLTGLKNDRIQKQAQKLQYQSTKTQLAIQDDESNLAKFEVLKTDTFNYFKRQVGPLNNVEFLKQLIADVEFVFQGDRSSGKAKQELVYDSFLQYIFQIDGVNYDTYSKNNIIIMIDELFNTYKDNLLEMCVKFHPGLKMPSKKSCMH